jgi:SAM-dependent methyltransferase
MYEQSKSIQRRLHDANFVTKYFRGHGIDIGAGPDPLGQYRELFPLMQSVRGWDIDDGDAELMASLSSHCLEHMVNPEIALSNWFRLVKPGGHLVVMVPDEDMYEQGQFPSTFNGDHKWTFTVFKKNSWSDHSRNVMDMLSRLDVAADILKIEQLTSTFRYRLQRMDQTLTPIGECAIEFVVRRRPQAEIGVGGRLPASR